MIIGHLAVSALEHRYVKAALVPVMASAVFPDLVDKIAHYGFGQHASAGWGTHYGALLTSAVVLALFGRHNAASRALGYLSHLVCDIGGVVPWPAPCHMSFRRRWTLHDRPWTGLTKPLLLVEIALRMGGHRAQTEDPTGGQPVRADQPRAHTPHTRP